jgi:hypothetical protein
MAAWLSEQMAAWLLGCMAVWMHGYMDAWLHGCSNRFHAMRDHGVHLVSHLNGSDCMAAWVLEPHACHERSWCALGQSPERVGLRLGLGHREERVLERIKVSKYGPIHVVRVFPETPDLVWIVTATARASTLNELDAA